MRALGIDIGGTGIKGAVVDLDTGTLVSERVRERTPQPATPEAVTDVAARICERLAASGLLTPEMPGGAGVPSVVKGGVTLTAANVDRSWIGVPARDLLSERLGRAMIVLNDADAAGVAEARFGAARGRNGVVLLVTIGTGVGTALLQNGVLVANSELGH
ncbi:MAG: ROK family protein, partial [Candidatus Limnocylindrales bacterium]